VFVDTLRLLKRMPGLFIPGLLIAVLDAIQIWFSLTGETFIAPRLLAVELVLMPFAFAAVYGAIKADDASFMSLLREGSRNYFRVLLPGLVVALGAVAIAVIATGLMTILVQTESVGLIVLMMMMVIGAFALLTLFFDTAAVFEECGGDRRPAGGHPVPDHGSPGRGGGRYPAADHLDSGSVPAAGPDHDDDPC